MQVSKETFIEDLVDKVPGSVQYMMDKGIMCIACGEPIWGTVEEVTRDKGFNDKQIDTMLSDLNRLT